VSGSISKVLTDQHFVQRSGSFVQEHRPALQMMQQQQQRKLIANSDIHNQILLSNKTMMMTTAGSPGARCNLLPGNLGEGLPFYGSSPKVPECTQYSGANGLPVNSASSSMAFGTSIPACSLSSSGAHPAMLHATHNDPAAAAAAAVVHEMQQQQNRIKYSPDEGLGDERSEFGGGGDESVATSGANAITA
jgi:hypothetical protein